MYDVVVVGGGPAGSRAAAILSKDRDVAVLEDHSQSGTPVQCAGLITQRTVDLSGVRPEILGRYNGADVVFPDGSAVSIKSDNEKAILIDRGDFDRKLAEVAMDSGAEYHYSTKYLAHTISDGKALISTNNGSLESKIIIGADGHTSSVADSIPDNKPKEYIRGIEYDIRHRMEHQDTITIRIGSVAPGLFSWEAPFGEFTRVGLCTSWSAGPPSEYLRAMMKKLGYDNKEIIAKYSGKIPLGGRRTTYSDNLLLIGDAAAQVKPVSAGGLYPAMACEKYLCQTVNEALDSGDLSARSLSSYERRWKADVGKELDKAYKLRKVYLKFNDEDMNSMAHLLGNGKANDILNGVDIDRPSSFALKAFSHPRISMKLLSVIMKSKVRR